MHSEKVGAFRAILTEKVGAFRANKTQKRGAHTRTALLWEYPLRERKTSQKCYKTNEQQNDKLFLNKVATWLASTASIKVVSTTERKTE